MLPQAPSIIDGGTKMPGRLTNSSQRRVSGMDLGLSFTPLLLSIVDATWGCCTLLTPFPGKIVRCVWMRASTSHPPADSPNVLH